MSILDLINCLRSAGLMVEEDEGRLRIKGPKGALTPELKSMIKDQREPLVEFLRSARSGEFFSDTIPVVSGEGPFETSHAQKRLWILQQMDPEMIAYNERGVTVFDGALDHNSFERALTR